METKISERTESPHHALTMRVLIADDGASSRDLLRSILESCGYEVAEAESCGQVVELARSCMPHLIILDLKISGGSGCGTVNELRRMPEFAKTPIVALAAAAMDVTPEQMVEAGFTTHLVKPIGPKRLRACIARLI